MDMHGTLSIDEIQQEAEKRLLEGAPWLCLKILYVVKSFVILIYIYWLKISENISSKKNDFMGETKGYLLIALSYWN